jgi:CDP-paratose 2-epimerase
VFHFAAQVAVTESLVNPQNDFDVNAGGTLQVLEAIREIPTPPALLFTSTNKVYGTLADLDLCRSHLRYSPAGGKELCNGINEQRNLDFHSPYGCSKGAADQYILDYARTFRLPAVVFRMSCIYGPHQNGTEDQGWVAHFLIRAVDRAKIQVYGDGKQVRDLLYVKDLLDAFELAINNIETTAGQAFNIGGGAQNAISLLELLELIRGMRGEPCRVEFQEWRHADQRYYVSDTRKFQSVTGWAPQVRVANGLELLRVWLERRRERAAEATSVIAVSREPSSLAGSAAVGRD